ncbi:MAG: hypothetical protein F4049_02010, partial [Gemmatimonadetes bacterium]|nr:hypothetical protein [Gemmatimonadota bacterium]
MAPLSGDRRGQHLAQTAHGTTLLRQSRRSWLLKELILAGVSGDLLQAFRAKSVSSLDNDKECNMDKVRIGIIGLGGMGSNHATYLSQGQIAGAELAAVADVDPARLAGVQEKYGESVQA